MVGSKLGLQEFFNATKLTKHGFLCLRREHDKGYQTKHSEATETVFLRFMMLRCRPVWVWTTPL